MYELKSPLTPHPAYAAAGISPAPVTHSRRPDQAEKAQKKQGSSHRPNTLYHNIAASTIRTLYTAFYIGGSISIPPNNKSL